MTPAVGRPRGAQCWCRRGGFVEGMAAVGGPGLQDARRKEVPRGQLPVGRVLGKRGTPEEG